MSVYVSLYSLVLPIRDTLPHRTSFWNANFVAPRIGLWVSQLSSLRLCLLSIDQLAPQKSTLNMHTNLHTHRLTYTRIHILMNDDIQFSSVCIYSGRVGFVSRNCASIFIECLVLVLSWKFSAEVGFSFSERAGFNTQIKQGRKRSLKFLSATQKPWPTSALLLHHIKFKTARIFFCCINLWVEINCGWCNLDD